jgi:aspartate 1-decarboxylase
MEAVGLLPYEAILVSNVATGLRAQTYVLPGARGSGSIELNGAMARLGTVGDRVIVMAFAEFGREELAGHQPRVVALDHKNRIVERIEYPPVAQAREAGHFTGGEPSERGQFCDVEPVGPRRA